jgi:hypothetical protein
MIREYTPLSGVREGNGKMLYPAVAHVAQYDGGFVRGYRHGIGVLTCGDRRLRVRLCARTA